MGIRVGVTTLLDPPSIATASRELSRRRDEFTEEILAAYRSCSWAELALRRQGWTPERLHKAARKITNDYVALHIPYLSQDRRDELADFVLEKALAATLRFRPDYPTQSYASNGGSHFDSWICDIMANRCPDWFRSKSEGNGDRRYGNDNRVVFNGFNRKADPDRALGGLEPDPADHDTDFEDLVDERRRSRWQQAADTTGWPLSEWVVITLDRGAKQVLESAA